LKPGVSSGTVEDRNHDYGHNDQSTEPIVAGDVSQPYPANDADCEKGAGVTLWVTSPHRFHSFLLGGTIAAAGSMFAVLLLWFAHRIPLAGATVIASASLGVGMGIALASAAFDSSIRASSAADETSTGSNGEMVET
jgi:hypothetical protein